MITNWKKFASEVHDVSVAGGTWLLSKDTPDFDNEALYRLLAGFDDIGEDEEERLEKRLVYTAMTLLDMASEWELGFRYMFAEGSNLSEDVFAHNTKWLVNLFANLIECIIWDLELPTSVGFEALDVDVCRFIEIASAWLRLRNKSLTGMMEQTLADAKQIVSQENNNV